MKQTSYNRQFNNFSKLIFYFDKKSTFKKWHISALLLCMFSSSIGVFAQSNDCTSPPALTVNATSVSGTTSGATQTMPAITCYYTGSADDDVFYKFTTTTAGNYVITVVGSGNFDAVIDLRTGTCNGSSLACSDVTANGGTESITYNAQANTTYNIRVYDYNLIGAYSNASNFTISVSTQNPIITTQPSNQTTCTSVGASFTIAASASGNISYQWQMSPDNNTWYLISNGTPTGVTYSGSSTSSLNVTGTSTVSNYYYRCQVTACGYSTLSNSASLIINSAPAITSNPTNVSMFTGASVNFNATATGAGITYQWQYNNSGTWGTVANGTPAGAVYTNATTANLNVSSISVTGNFQYRCAVSGTCSSAVNSSAATLTVNQSSADNWNTHGNSATTAGTNFIGTTDNTDLVSKVNNAEAMRIKVNGNVGINNNNPSEKLDVTGNAKISGALYSGAITAPSLKLNGLSGSTNRLLQTDATGNIAPLTMGSATQILLGDGTWGNLPSAPPVLWQPATNGTDIFNTTGKVGIGTNNPQYPLDIIGDARISNNLYVGGGIVITDQVNAATLVNTAAVKTGTMSADSIKMDSTKAFYGTTNFTDNVNLKSKLNVTGDAVFNGNFRTNGNLTFAGNKTISFTPASSGHPDVLSFGAWPGPLPQPIPCFSPTVPLNLFGGLLQSGGTTSDGYTNLMSMGWDGANGIVDVAGSNSDGISPRLLVNYYCGKDVLICTGPNGGNISMSDGVNGGNVFMCTGLNGQAGLVGIGTTSPAAKLDVNGNMRVASLATATGGVVKADANGVLSTMQINTADVGLWHLGSNGTDIFNTTGNVGIGTDLTSSTYDNTFKLAVNGKIRAVEVDVQTGWSDFVFAKNYKLSSLAEVEKYIKANGHLPEIPTGKEIETNGGNLGELVKLQMQKIEELTLYIIEQNKRIESIEKQLNNK